MDKKILELENKLSDIKNEIKLKWYNYLLMEEKRLIKMEISELIYLKNKKWKKQKDESIN